METENFSVKLFARKAKTIMLTTVLILLAGLFIVWVYCWFGVPENQNHFLIKTEIS